MKFINGYWLMKDGIIPTYAVEYADHVINGNELTIYTQSKHINHRGDQLNIGTLTVRLTSPRKDIIKVSSTHFEGAVHKGPYAEVKEEEVDVQINVLENAIEYISGNTKAVIDTRPNSWSISFYDGDVLQTKTGYRNMAYM